MFKMLLTGFFCFIDGHKSTIPIRNKSGDIQVLAFICKRCDNLVYSPSYDGANYVDSILKKIGDYYMLVFWA